MTTTQTQTESRKRTDGKPHREGKATKIIERTTAGIPSVAFLIAAGGAIAGALTLKLMGRHSTANFVGEWVPTILMLGLYNKIVKTLGSEGGETAVQE
jgi:hypothetical protein